MSDLPITAVDIVVLLILVISAVAAFARGFVHEVLSIGAWVGAGLATIYIFPVTQPWARDLIAIPLLADIGSGIAIFILVLILLSIVTRLLAARVKGSALGALDRSLGFVFGALRGAVIVALAWLVLVWALPEPADRPVWIQEAKSRRLIEASAGALASILPGAIGDSRQPRETAPANNTTQPAERSDFEQYLKPKTQSRTPTPEQGYDDSERQQMDSTIESLTSGSGGSSGQ